MNNNKTSSSSTAAATTSTSSSISTLTTLLDVSDGILGRKIALFLSGGAILQLSLLSKAWKQFAQTNQEPLFRTVLQNDFAEGRLLVEIMNQRRDEQQQQQQQQQQQSSLSSMYKQMYRAFRRRWKLPGSAGGDTGTAKAGRSCDQAPPIGIHWRNPYRNCRPPDEPSSDARALVFIVRVGNVNESNGPETCGLMGWEQNGEEPGKRPGEDRLVLDEVWFDDNFVDFPDLTNQVCRWIDDWENDVGDHYWDIDKAIKSSYRLTLHVVDLQRCQVMTLMENEPPQEVQLDSTIEACCHGMDAPNLYGLMPPGSPFYRPTTDLLRYDDRYYCLEEGENAETATDLLRYDDHYYWLEEDENVEILKFAGGLRLDRLYEDDEVRDDVVFPAGPDGISFDFSLDTTVTQRDEICSFFRALMKEKCPPGDCGGFVSIDAPATTMPQQPNWVATEGVPDAILSFSSFEEQAGALRLVCRQFKDSAMRQMETKLLDEVKVIGFDRWYNGWFKASVRRGWSDDPFAVTKESVVDESLYMASCRCFAFDGNSNSCPGMDSCPGTNEVVTFGPKNTVFDLDQARTLLKTNGWLRLTPSFPGGQDRRLKSRDQHVKIRFQGGEKSLFGICNDVARAVGKEVSYVLVPETFQESYGLSGSDMTSRQFIRSLFLVFLHTTFRDDQQEENPTKMARLAEPSIGMAKSFVGGFVRMKMIARFYTMAGEPIEIRLESKHNLTD